VSLDRRRKDHRDRREASGVPLHTRDRGAEGAGCGGCLEHARSREGRAGVHRRRSLAEPDLFVSARSEIIEFLAQKWERELDYALRKNLWCFEDSRVAVRFQYESHDRDGQWWRSYGNELSAVSYRADESS
jgi:hypothetical protein